MKAMLKKNQMMIFALTLMIAVAGYLNFNSGNLAVDNPDASKQEKESQDVSDMMYNGAVGNMDDAVISANLEDTVEDASDMAKNDVANEAEDSTYEDSIDTEKIGETILTSGQATANFLVEAKLNREQMRAKSKEILNGIIENESISEDAKKDAISALVEMTENMEMEYAAEQQLGVKGFANAIVSISEESVDVTIAKAELSETEKAQIEDIVMRKVNCEVSDIVITTMKSEN